MKHPLTEEWMSFLYGEVSLQRRSELDAHLQQCADCGRRVQTWRDSMQTLDAWQMPCAPRRSWPRPVIRWAAAAAIILCIGFGVGRLSSSTSSHLASWKASLEKDFDRKLAEARAELRQQQTDALTELAATAATAHSGQAREALAEFAKTSEEKRTADIQAIISALNRLDSKWAEGFASLRQELQTVALLTEDSLEDTQAKLANLYTFAQASEVK